MAFLFWKPSYAKRIDYCIQISFRNIMGVIFNDFKASRGWFKKFKGHSCIHSISKKCMVKLYFWISLATELKDYAKVKGFISWPVFKSDETSLFWRKMPNKMFIMLEGKTLSGYKLMKYRLLRCCVIMLVVI